MRRNAGFTLIEMMVVIMVISILMGILLPVFARVREAGRRTKCSHNLLEIGQATHMYTEDYRGWYPTTLADGSTAALTDSLPTNRFRSAASPRGKEVGIGRLWVSLIESQDTSKMDEVRDVVTCPSTNYWVQSMDGIDKPTDTREHFCSYVYRGGGAPYGADGKPSSATDALRMFTADDRDTMMQRVGNFVVATDANQERAQHHDNHDGKMNLSLFADASVNRKDLPGSGLNDATEMMYFLDGH
jgi:prepilin-type N-terminal cleavage/methylation domain-containing protein